MAYETGTATSISDLLSKLITFATANGWAVNTPTYTKSGTYSQSGTTGIVTVSGLTGHTFAIGETVDVDITSGGAVDGAYPVLSTTSSTITYQGVASSTSGNATISASSGKIFTKGGKYFAFGQLNNNMVVAGATGYDSVTHWLAQPGASAVRPRSNDMDGPFQAYHFFANSSPDYLHVVVERSAGIYKHIVVGELVKSGSYTGGEYVCACYWHPTVVNSSQAPNWPDNVYHSVPFDVSATNTTPEYRSAVRADIDGKTNNWMDLRDANTWNGNYAKGSVRGSNLGILESLHERSPSEFNQITPLLPILVGADRPSSMVSPLGYVPDIRYINMTNISPGELLTIGSDEWLCFPLIQKTATWNNSSSAIPSSGTYGLAYKRN